MTTSFDQRLAFGKIAESHIATWLRRARGWSVLPVYEQELAEGKGPQFFTPDSEVVAPDMLAMKGDQVRWIEAKRKTVFSWRGVGGYWETGIDLRHYHEYLRVADLHPWSVWLLFLHESSRTDPRDVERWGAPATCPTGLYGGTIAYLRDHESHTDPRWGRTGMVYWKHETLKQLATLDEVRAAATAPGTDQGRDTLRTIAGQPTRTN